MRPRSGFGWRPPAREADPDDEFEQWIAEGQRRAACKTDTEVLKETGGEHHHDRRAEGDGEMPSSKTKTETNVAAGDDDDGIGYSDGSLYADIAALLDGTRPARPQPSVLKRVDGIGIFYMGKQNLLYGDPEDGKTWIALAACTETLRGDGKVLYIDLDRNGEDAMTHNLLMLGAPPDVLRSRDRYRYCEPDSAMWIIKIVEECTIWQPTVMVVDSVGELLPLFGSSSNSGDDYIDTANRVMRPLIAAGACGISIDHLAKNPESRAIGPTGAVAKRARVGGVSIRVARGRQFIPGKGGTAHLYVNKDRHGGLREHCPPGRSPEAGTFVMDSPDEHNRAGWRVILPLDMRGDVTGLDAVATQYLRAAQELGDTDFDLAALAAQLEGEPQPTKDQLDQAHYNVAKLLDAGKLKVTVAGHKGRGGAARWKVVNVC